MFNKTAFVILNKPKSKLQKGPAMYIEQSADSNTVLIYQISLGHLVMDKWSQTSKHMA